MKSRLLNRRSLLMTGAAAVFRPLKAAASPTFADRYFLPIVTGFLKNSVRTSGSFAVCDFKDGLKLPGSVAKSGKTYDSVSRMLPALAAWVASGREPTRMKVDGEDLVLEDVLLKTFVNAFDPEHPDYWRESPAERQHQLQVESSIVAWALFVAADRIIPRMTPKQRANVQAWLASCTRVPVRNNNWAWFTALNQAVRLNLGRKWNEFSGDSRWMVDDLRALDAMAVPGDEGWYTDSVREPVYDYYNFWVFASHFLYWNEVIGRDYPEWSTKFGTRVKAFMERAPYFFGANGSHVLFGRSLIYRWAVLTPLVLAYQQKMWPHSPGLLRAIVRRNIEYQWDIGGFDLERGKLRESLTPDGTLEIKESYIDNGHPYWGMQAFAFYRVPASDPFWTAPEELLPVERRNFAVRFEGPRMMLAGDRATGEVRWIHSVNGHNEVDYRDKYTKFSYSSHFPYCILKDKRKAVWDGTLVFRDPATGETAGRSAMRGGRLLDGGVEREWSAKLGSAEIRVRTTLRYAGLYEHRRHEIEAPEGTVILEGSYALASGRGTPAERSVYLRNVSGAAVALYGLRGYRRAFVEEEVGTNIVHKTVHVASLEAAAGRGVTVLECVHYASVKPESPEAVEKGAVAMGEKA